MEKTPKKCGQVKPINNTLKTQKVKLNSLTDLHNIQQDHVRSKLKGNVIFNSREVTYRINSDKLKTLFTSSHKQADTKIVYCSSSFNKLRIVKAKDTDII